MRTEIEFNHLFSIPLKNGVTRPKKVRGEGFKMVNMGEIFSLDFISNENMDRVPLNEKEQDNFQLKQGDLLFARQSLVRNGAGKCSIFLGSHEITCFESHIIRVRLDKNKCFPLFYYYYFSSSAGRNLMDSIIEQGAGAAGIRGSDLAKLRVPYMDLYEQKLVAENLFLYDQKIHLNTQTNQTLEQIAQAIYKSWFVDYEPTRAKAAVLAAGGSMAEAETAAMTAISGKSAAELAALAQNHPARYQQLATLAQAFPAALTPTEDFGDIPEGWEVKPLDEIAHYQNGLALQKFRPENDREYLPVVKIAQLRQGYADGSEKASININSNCIIDNGDIIFSWSGTLMVDVWCGGRAALNQHLFKVTSKNYPKWFYYHHTKHHLDEFQRIASGKAVTMGHIKREHLSQALCAVPSIDFLNSQCKIMEQILDRIIANRLENFSLASIRDSLLPKLLSGEFTHDLG